MIERISDLPPRPPSEVEWEDLLLRVELMARAVRNALEELDPVAARIQLQQMVRRELRVAEWLEARAGVSPRRDGMENAANRTSSSVGGDAAALAERFGSLRARNFAMVQRRGLVVWEWSGEFDEEGPVTAFQLLSWLVRHDVRSLEALRQGTAPAC